MKVSDKRRSAHNGFVNQSDATARGYLDAEGLPTELGLYRMAIEEAILGHNKGRSFARTVLGLKRALAVADEMKHE